MAPIGVDLEGKVKPDAMPDWWEWELELTHLEKRMEDREFAEVDLRAMLEQAEAIISMWSKADG